MPGFNDLTGKKIDFWNVISRAPNEGTATCWNCVCSCGVERIVRASHLSSGASKSCGCRAPVLSTHGEARNGDFSKKYKTWRSIRARCLDPNNKDADIYNGLLCEEWKDFNNFNRDVPEPSDKSLTIDRIKNERGYEPGNVRWITMAEQHRNQTNNRWIEFNGKKQLLIDWANEIGITSAALSVRIEKYGLELAITTPNNKHIAPASNKMSLTKNGITDSYVGWMRRLHIGQPEMNKRIANNEFS